MPYCLEIKPLWVYIKVDHNESRIKLIHASMQLKHLMICLLPFNITPAVATPVNTYGAGIIQDCY